ncbi:protein transport protein Sec31A isoform X2 [Periophthalmus magnuspinnatus]|uniref:protein transport protein Sec31A isoform X2 n=1 Tax=Periophthalmus magnuspinnatus TaxID=409849 RepID=UPI00145B153C|nr:protein transport protein Sec31A isoform X2 [Periophthalmus magnuspinnatus]
MRLKEIQRTAHQAWSPAGHHPIHLALGTSAQQLDASFNTTAALEIFELDFSDPSLDMELKGSVPTTNRLHSLVWVNFGLGEDGSGGRLVAGSENGTVSIYKPEAIVSSAPDAPDASDAEVGSSNKHTGPVRALDFNPFQNNLLASGANDSEIYIWDLNNFSSPMTPGAKTQPAEDVSVISWNRQVQHILASASPSGKAVVWDLRKNEPIIKISDHSNRMHCSGMLWHPDVATQLVLASEDDRLPVIQMWDLRFATSPLKVLENHTRGILSISWSQADPELLLSSAKDNRILCWNPNTGEVIYELPTINQWCFDVQWCPRNPSLLSTASFDGMISVYSVMGGSLTPQRHSTVHKISSSFDSMDPFGTGQMLPPLQVPQPQTQTTIVPPLKKPPKWIRRPVGASFGFGGKLVTFECPKLPPGQSPQSVPRQVHLSQVTTETEFLQRSRELQTALQTGAFNSYCQSKIQEAKSDAEQDIWKFLLVNFEDEARIKFLRLLGFSKDDLELKISKCLGRNYQANGHGVDAKDLAEKMLQLSSERSEDADAAATTSGSVSPADFFSQTPKQTTNFQIPVSCDTDGLISQALLVGNFEGAVDLCLNDGRYAEAILLAISGGEELLKKTQQKYLSKQKNSVSMLISSVVTQNWRDIVESCELDNWKEALAALLTYAHPEDFAHLCDTLGARLEAEQTEKRCLQACLCYICSGNIEKLVECWAQHRDCSSPLGLEDLVEKVMMLRKSIERLRNGEVSVQSPILADKLTRYAGILAAEGSLSIAAAYLPENSEEISIKMLKDRLFHAQGEGTPNYSSRPNQPAAKPAPAPAPQPSAPKAHTMGQYQPQPPQPPQMPQMPQMPSLFTPQSPTSNTGPGLPPGGLGMNPSAPRQMRPSYPQHPPAPGFIPQPPFQPQPVGAPSSFPPPPGPNMPPSSMSMPPSSMSMPPSSMSMPPSSMSMPPSSLSGRPSSLSGPPSSMSMPPSSMSGPPSSLSGPLQPPGVPPTAFMPSTSLPSGPVAPPSSQPGAPVPMYPGAIHTQQGPAPAMPGAPFTPMGAGYPQGGPGAPAATMPPPPTGPQEGWNDPPAVRGGPRKKKVPDNYTPPAPITAPVMGYEAPQPQDLHTQVPPGAPQEPTVQLLQQLPAERVEQKEIPSEHLVLKSTFDSLVQRCQLAAGDPQTKRKLDDAAKRLGSLYDKLRDQSLSPHILNGLHEISRCVAAQSYQRGLEVHTQIVSSSNFSEISGFMPILKVLMTIATRLGV